MEEAARDAAGSNTVWPGAGNGRISVCCTVAPPGNFIGTRLQPGGFMDDGGKTVSTTYARLKPDANGSVRETEMRRREPSEDR